MGGGVDPMSMCNLIENTKKFKNNKKFVELLQR